MPSKSKQNSKRNSKKQLKGGDASHHAIAVYGDAGQQNSVGAGSNVIAQNSVENKVEVPVVKGGNKEKYNEVALEQEGGGKGLITDLAVPAVLLYANQLVSKKSKKSEKKRRSNKRKSNRRFGKK
jgi:hypothetical protein